MNFFIERYMPAYYAEVAAFVAADQRRPAAAARRRVGPAGADPGRGRGAQQRRASHRRRGRDLSERHAACCGLGRWLSRDTLRARHADGMMTGMSRRYVPAGTSGSAVGTHPGLLAGRRDRATADEAGWRYSGLRVLAFGAGETRTVETGDTEVFLLPLSATRHHRRDRR